MSYAQKINDLAAGFAASFEEHHKIFCTAESCTGGLIAGSITEISGSSQWFERGFVTYTNTAKEEMLGVQASTLQRVGAVSRETAKEMAEGALAHSHADISVAVTGIAGPTGGSAEKPVGTVWIAFCVRGQQAVAHCHHFDGDRHAVRSQTIIEALDGLLACANGVKLLDYE